MTLPEHEEKQFLDQIKFDFELPEAIEEAQSDRRIALGFGVGCLSVGSLIVNAGVRFGERNDKLGTFIELSSVVIASPSLAFGVLSVGCATLGHVRLRNLQNEQNYLLKLKRVL